MKSIIALLFSICISNCCFSQLSTEILLLRKETLKNSPKRTFKKAEKSASYTNIYYYDKVNKSVYKIIHTNKLRDTLFTFIYINKEIKYCGFVKWRGKKYRNDDINHIYFKNSEIVYSSKKLENSNDTLFFFQKSRNLYTSGENFLLKK